MLNATKQRLKKTLKRWGWTLERYHPHRDKFQLLRRLCDDHDCRSFIDIGANEGQFALALIDAGYYGEIVSIEPQSEAHRKLSLAAAAHNLWRVAPRMCMGARNGTTVINIAANSVSSSILPVLDASTSANPDTRYVGVEEVPIYRLDDWFLEAGYAPSVSLALKLDVQGYESHVLEGATALLSRVRVVILEMSLVPLYDGAAGFSELYRWLEDRGFVSAGIFSGFTDRRSSRMLQVDAVFERPGSVL